jgi:hypothetical protein
MTTYPNWFRTQQHNFEKYVLDLAGQPVQMLQIGAFTGDASAWMYDNILVHHEDAFLVDVDTWQGSDEPEHDVLDWEHVELTYLARNKTWQGAVWRRKMTSDEWFMEYGGCYEWDFAYIDGDHKAVNVLTDGLNAFQDLKVGGIIAFDDYGWKPELSRWERPEHGVKAFLSLCHDYYETLEIGYQVWLKKTAHLPAL